MATPTELVAAARAGDLPELVTGHSNAVFDGGDFVVKRFKSQARCEPEREWEALHLLGKLSPGLVPRAVHLDLDDPPCLVTERVDGRELRLDDLDDERIVGEVAGIHRFLASVVPTTGRSMRVSLTHPAILTWRCRRVVADRVAAMSDGREVEGLHAVAAWLVTEEATNVGRTERQAISRGDAKLANYLWDGTRMTLLDLEDTGWSDPLQDVAELVEHRWNRGVPTDAWHAVARAVGADPTGSRMLAARRMLASFWLAILIPHAERLGPGSLEEQAARTLSVLSASPP